MSIKHLNIAAGVTGLAAAFSLVAFGVPAYNEHEEKSATNLVLAKKADMTNQCLADRHMGEAHALIFDRDKNTYKVHELTIVAAQVFIPSAFLTPHKNELIVKTEENAKAIIISRINADTGEDVDNISVGEKKISPLAFEIHESAVKIARQCFDMGLV